jgi:hypothetical protein
MHRPTPKELNNKLKEAKEAVARHRIAIVNPVSFSADALDLGYLIADISDILPDLFDEIIPSYYAGHKPPQRSYEDKIKGCELFAFQWESPCSGCDIYLKFALQDGCLWLVSLHRSREK